jgi:AraC family transcriptional regulator, transcriptional activator of pobA
MTATSHIPVFALYGQTAPFPDIVHIERLADRATSDGWTISAHRHGQMSQLIVIATGGASARIDDEACRLSPGDFLFIPPHAVHSYDFRPGTGGHVISLPTALLGGEGASGLGATLARPLHGRADTNMRRLVALLVDAVAAKGRFRTQLVMALAQALLAGLAETSATQGEGARAPRDGRLMQLDALIAARMAQGWGVADYAQALQVSTGHLGRLCRAASGMGAKAYIEQAVMGEASRLLAFTRLPMSEIGYRLGFDDPSHFSKRFRAARGLAPSAYRRQLEGRMPTG